jgi:hypothetical protein
VNRLSAADLIVIVEFFVALLGLLYFVIRYAVSTEGGWRRTAEGRHLMFFRGSLAAWALMGVVHNLVPDYPGKDAVRVTVVGLFALATVHGDALLERAQAARRRRDRARRESLTQAWPPVR